MGKLVIGGAQRDFEEDDHHRGEDDLRGLIKE